MRGIICTREGASHGEGSDKSPTMVRHSPGKVFPRPRPAMLQVSCQRLKLFVDSAAAYRCRGEGRGRKGVVKNGEDKCVCRPLAHERMSLATNNPSMSSSLPVNQPRLCPHSRSNSFSFSHTFERW